MPDTAIALTVDLPDLTSYIELFYECMECQDEKLKKTIDNS